MIFIKCGEVSDVLVTYGLSELSSLLSVAANVDISVHGVLHFLAIIPG